MFQSLRPLLDGPEPVTAPLVLNPLMAKMAEEAGFRAVYLGGGSLGYLKVYLEANLGLVEMAQAGLEVAAATSLPIILDGACGWGDPMHIHRTIATAEAAGFAAIEIEDQVVPKRAHHHAGVEHLVTQELMEAKVREAAAARRDPEFVIIARTNAMRAGGLDEAMRRAEGYRRAGADLVLVSPGFGLDPAEISIVAERLGPPLMLLCPPGGLASYGLSLAEAGRLGYRLAVDAQTLLSLQYDALAAGYAELARGDFAYRSRTAEELGASFHAMNSTIGLDAMLAIEKETVERDA